MILKKYSIALLALFFFACSDFSSDANEYELSKKYYACDTSTKGDFINDTEIGEKKYCNGINWVDVVPFSSVSSSSSFTTEYSSAETIAYECEDGSIVNTLERCPPPSPDYLPLNDSEFPYAGIPRIVIETEHFRSVKDKDTEIPAKLQLWGDKNPLSDIMELTIKGRGNTSWSIMPQKSYKLEFLEKTELLGFPQNKDWALITSYADKSLMRNHLVYQIAATIGLSYTPKTQFVEVYLNREYMGVYLLAETIKIGKNRVNIPQNNSSFLVEIDDKYKQDEPVVISYIGHPQNIHYPKNPSESTKQTLKTFIDKYEHFLVAIDSSKKNDVENWISVSDYAKHFWIQEFSKNPDAAFLSSVYYTWEKDGVIKMGPVWDFDIAFGSYDNEKVSSPINWRTKNTYWNKYLFKDSVFAADVDNEWKKNEKLFKSVFDSIDVYQSILAKPARNHFKRWNILKSTDFAWHNKSFSSYEDAVNDLKSWIQQRIIWIESQTQ